MSDIPCDYNGVMGVPITFLDKYNPNQFELIGQMATTKVNEYNFGYPYVNGKKIYARILIRRKQNSAAYKIEDSNSMAAEDNAPYGNNSNI